MQWLIDILLGLVEGFTEFLPISSTGHLIIVRAALGLEESVGFRQMIVMQGAAILAVCWEYRQRLWSTARSLTSDAGSRRFAANLFLAFLPAAVVGLLLEDTIRSLLFAPVPVAMALVVGGLAILWAEKRPHIERIRSVDEIGPLDALRSDRVVLGSIVLFFGLLGVVLFAPQAAAVLDAVFLTHEAALRQVGS